MYTRDEDKLAKNLLLGNTCFGCNHVRVYEMIKENHKCSSFLRARREFEIIYIDTPEFKSFKDDGLDLPKEGVCQFWE